MATKEASKYFGYQQITNVSVAVGLTVPTRATDGNSTPTGPTYCLLQAEGAPIRWRDDGTAPTASAGMILYPGDAPFPYDGPLSAIRFIQASATAILNVSYYAS